MRLCSCGFANPDDAMRCAACGGALSHESAGDTLLLEDVRSGEVVRIPAPGGILGRAGDFSPTSSRRGCPASMPWWPSTAKGAGPSSTRPQRVGRGAVVASGRICAARAPTAVLAAEIAEAGRHGVPRAGGHPGGRGGRGRRGIGRAGRSRRNCLVRAMSRVRDRICRGRPRRSRCRLRVLQGSAGCSADRARRGAGHVRR